MNKELKNKLNEILKEENQKIGNNEGIDSGSDLYDFILAYRTDITATEDECIKIYEIYENIN